MTPHPNLKRAFLVLGVSVGIGALQAQNPPANPGRANPGQATPGQATPSPDRQSTRSESDTTDRKARTATTDSTTAAKAGEGSELMVGPADQKFLMESAQSGMFEVQLAQLAQQKASSSETKDYAKQIEQDHSKANEELKALAKQKNVELPADIGPKNQEKLAKFNNLSGEQFDREYTKAMASNHKKSVKEFQKQTEKGMDSHVKEFAAKTVPTFQTHLQKAEEMRNTGTRARTADTAPKPDTGNQSDPIQRPRSQDNPGTPPQPPKP